MDLKLFISTFALVFLAELGDKTQLASMAASAGTRSPWSVFAGAASALVISTLIAVLAGSFLQRAVPQHYIKGVAALLFLVFGVILLVNAVQVRKETLSSEHIVPAATPKGILAKVAMRAAAEFERGSADDYDRLAKSIDNEGLRAIFEHLAAEERQHLSRLSTIQSNEALPQHYAAIQETPATSLNIALDQSSQDILQKAINHEQSTARFYRALADSAIIPDLRTAFLFLSAEEESHAAHLEEYRTTGASDILKKH